MEDWRPLAKCFGVKDPDFFFPVGIQGNKVKGSPSRDTAALEAEAAKFCVGCPVRFECLDWALENQKEGVAGGYTSLERKRIKRRRREVA